MKNHFIMTYAGNKREEVETIYNNIDFKNITSICEPYCGSSAISYYISTKHPKKYTYILNDNDTELMNLYKTLCDPIKTSFFFCMVELNINKVKSFKELEDRKTHYRRLPHGGIRKYIYDKFRGPRQGMYPTRDENRMRNITTSAPIMDFLRNEKIIFLNMDGVEVVKKYNNKKCLMILDPPYIMTDNTMYDIPSFSVYEYSLHNKIYNMYLILEYTWLIKILYNPYKIIQYDKKYNGFKKKTVKHAIIKNQD